MSENGPICRYLKQYFVDKAALATLAGLSIDVIDRLVSGGAVPRPAYVCDGWTMHTAAFGRTEIEERICGEFFRRGDVRWLRIAVSARHENPRDAVQRQVTEELCSALRLSGVSAADVSSKLHTYLPHFWDGTFSLSVAEPETGVGIVAKRRLQEQLIRLSQDGRDPAPSGIARSLLLELIESYRSVTMPFSPAEYELSSRKRLVDDYRKRVIAHHDSDRESFTRTSVK